MKQAPAVVLLALALVFAWVAACNSRSSPSGSAGSPPPPPPGFGLTERIVVQGLTFPTDAPQGHPVQASVAFPGLRFEQPLFLGAVPDGRNRLVVAEQGGRIRIFANDPAVATAPVFLDITDRTAAFGEEGLLGVAFHPDYATNGQFYVYYSAMVGARRSVLARYRVLANDPDRADPASAQILLEFEQPFSNHNGGALAFGPDGMLYVGSGDGGSGNDPLDNAQSLGNLLGKVLRLTPDGGIPADNPFVGTQGARGEIWAYGLRNPWRIAFDRDTGTLWAGDVGQDAEEEIDIIRRGANYGWRVYEGYRSNVNPRLLPPGAFTSPVHVYTHADGQSLTGGFVYRGDAMPGLRGAYVYGDYASGRVWALMHDGPGRVAPNTEIAAVPSPASFGEDAAGELYACSFDGRIYRFDAAVGGGGRVQPYPTTLAATGLFTDVRNLVPTPGLIEYEVNAPLWSDGARKRRFMALPGQAQITFAAGEAFALPVGTVLVKHFEIELATGATQRLETRVLVHRRNGWEGRTYRWNSQGTDAVLLTGSEEETITTRDAAGQPRAQRWSYPSPSQCLSCHTAAAGRVLGLRAAQLNRTFPYPSVSDNQLRAWNHIALFTTDVGDHAGYPALADPADPAQPIAARARAYLDANCANCHRPGGPTSLDLDLRGDVDVAQMRAFGVLASIPVGGDPTRLRAAVGNKERSDLWERLRRRDVFAMPSLASRLADPLAIELIGAWIDGR